MMTKQQKYEIDSLYRSAQFCFLAAALNFALFVFSFSAEVFSTLRWIASGPAADQFALAVGGRWYFLSAVAVFFVMALFSLRKANALRRSKR